MESPQLQSPMVPLPAKFLAPLAGLYVACSGPEGHCQYHRIGLPLVLSKVIVPYRTYPGKAPGLAQAIIFCLGVIASRSTLQGAPRTRPILEYDSGQCLGPASLHGSHSYLRPIKT
jgi:hypothetical protein